jgi:hypothetical protein
MKWVGKKLIWQQKWVNIDILEIYPITLRHNHADDLRAIN